MNCINLFWISVSLPLKRGLEYQQATCNRSFLLSVRAENKAKQAINTMLKIILNTTSLNQMHSFRMQRRRSNHYSNCLAIALSVLFN